ncbi:MAG TPA: hypothetical protein VHK63_05120, partial [Candidatus Limnocylindria bacterium]|nr:hypothetical protein [Candidatus Limnocylindria bacterium]
RRAAERAAAAAEEAARNAEARLQAVATAVGLPPDAAPDQAVEGLRAWRRRRAEELRRGETEIADWQRLQGLLEGRSVADLASQAAADAAAASALLAQLGEQLAPPTDDLPLLEAQLRAAREALLAEVTRCESLQGNLQARREVLPDVTEAEESVLAARAELERVQCLADTLDRTLAILRAAEERVHRSLSPVLAATIRAWLPVVCAGAYQDVSVDPADLAVRVKEAATGKWRDARLLSEGTREQIYLLLRVAMAEHLVTNGETAPLLLDEVTVQSDAGRKAALLDVLHRLSAERQVILFSHDDDVLAWAGRHLLGERDRVIVLPARPMGDSVRAAAQATTASPIGD